MSAAEIMQSPQKLSSAQLRKIKKPIIEKRRRERINESLNQLKGLVLEALDKDENQYNKMEKADILEMTVKHLRALQRQVAQVRHTQTSPSAGSSSRNTQAPNTSSLVTASTSYKSGYSECAEEVRRYLGTSNLVSGNVKSQLNTHLNTRVPPTTHSSYDVTPSHHDVRPKQRRDSVCSSNGTASSSGSPSPSSSPVHAFSPASRDSFNGSPVSDSTSNITAQVPVSSMCSNSMIAYPTVAMATNSAQPTMLLAANGQMSPILSGQGFVPIVISPVTQQTTSPHYGHMTSSHMTSQQQQQGSPMAGTVIPLYQTNTSQQIPSPVLVHPYTQQNNQSPVSHHQKPVHCQRPKSHDQRRFKDIAVKSQDFSSHEQFCNFPAQKQVDTASESVWRPW